LIPDPPGCGKQAVYAARLADSGSALALLLRGS